MDDTAQPRPTRPPRSRAVVLLLMIIGPAVGLAIALWSLGQGLGPAMAAAAQYQAAPACAPDGSGPADCYSLQPAQVLSVHRDVYKCAETDELILLVAGTERRADVPLPWCENALVWPEQTQVKLYRGSITAVFDGIGEYRETDISPAQVTGHFTVQILAVPFLGVWTIGVAFGLLRDRSFLKTLIRDLLGRPASSTASTDA